MKELIYRDDCDLNAPSLDRDEMIWDLIYEMNMPDSDETFNFAKAFLEKAQNIIDTAPTVTTDEVMAYNCPECHTITLVYSNDTYCPWELKIENAWNMPQEEWAHKVFEADIDAINSCDILIIISIGRVSTAGTNWEQGYAYAKGIPTHVIQITGQPTSLMTYWGSHSFINQNIQYNSMKSNLIWILEHPQENSYEKCRTVLT